MSDLISKNEAAKIAKGFTFTFTEERQRYMDFLEYCLNNAPTVDVKPIVHGRWLDTEYGTLCTACGRAYDRMFEITRDRVRKFKFCPNCGAYMKGEMI